ncbi:hypothetical protein HFO56_01115 [Rhizobium laguerreae]|uniref:hypothetical protein n=1 Tax=Rhizobium laguerreae TaxID=1076926 RepID=UPI001C91F62A|nr:hypothetical protein [Rhizobium laguerreae]MBY3151027.1 hypothetical protein [Rhizobium laguerreae]
MRILTIALIVAAPLALVSCVSSRDYDSRYGASAGGEVESSFTGGVPAGKPQFGGWTTRTNDREAERKSIARDIPYGVVSPSGTVVFH